MRLSLTLARCAFGLAVLGWAGCGGESGGLGVETDEPLYREGQQLEKQGRTKEALAAYLRLISQRGDDAPQSHLEVGVIELQDIKDPIGAIYHFRRFRELEPNSPMTPRVVEQIQRAERDFAATLPANQWQSGGLGAEQGERLRQLEGENEQLKAELAALRGSAVRLPRPASAGGSPGDGFTPAMDSAPLVPAGSAPLVAADESAGAGPAEASSRPRRSPAGEGSGPSVTASRGGASRAATSPPARGGGKIHVVTAHDSLFGLSRKYYGTPTRWRDILNANRDKLGSGDHPSLRPGMSLRIP